MDYKAYSEEISRMIRPQTYRLGLKFIKDIDESEMLLTFPASDCESLIDDLKKTHEKGTRYPVQSYMIYQPPIIKPMKNLADKFSD
jgi:uncharacterized protein (DUF169 family)